MAALKEIKSRIISVRSTLKITSAMKMVASAKLHRVQAKAAALTEFEKTLSKIAAGVDGRVAEQVVSSWSAPHKSVQNVAVVAFSSDGSLCGSFNANVIRLLHNVVEQLKKEGVGQITVYPVGEKIAQAAHKAGYDTCDDFRAMAAAPQYAQMAELAQRLMSMYASGKVDKVCMVYNHFHSMSRQEPRNEVFLPMENAGSEQNGIDTTDYILEPEAVKLQQELLPYLLRIRMYAVLIDSATAEHAARTVAMQTASDNAQGLLDELSLLYNKRRQQAITEELTEIS